MVEERTDRGLGKEVEETAKTYKQQYVEQGDIWERLWKRGVYTNPVTEAFLSSLPPLSKVLDQGCGTGVFTVELLRRGHSVVAFDVVPEGVKVVREKVEGMKQPKGTVDLFVGELTTKTYLPEEFDGIIDYYSLQHLPQATQEQLLESMTLSLKAGGLLLLALFSTKQFLDRPDRYQQVGAVGWKLEMGEGTRYFYPWTSADLVRHLKGLGLQVLSTYEGEGGEKVELLARRTKGGKSITNLRQK